MAFKRQQLFWLEAEKKWTEKWFKFITSQYDKNINVISRNPNLTMEFIEGNPEYNWDWYGVSYNPNLTMEFIEAHPEYNWNCNGVSYNPNVTMEFIEAHPEYNWNWCRVSRNPNLTMELIEAHPEYPWNWRGVSKNPNLTMDFIEVHPEYVWHWREVQKNKFTKSKDLFMIEEAKKYMAVYKIKKWWKGIYYSPNTEVGKRRLEKSYNDLF